MEIMGQCKVISFSASWNRLSLEDVLDNPSVEGSQIRNVNA